MVRKNIGSLRPLIHAGVCGAGLLGGIAVGAYIVLGTGLLEWGQVFGTHLGSVFVLTASIAIVSGLGWLGAKIGLAIVERMQP